MRVLITGGAGFIGSHVAEVALAAGHEVAVLDNFSTGRRENLRPAARVYEVDLRDKDATLRALADFRPNAVSHQAAQASVAVSMREPTLDAENNIMGSLHLLDACTQHHVERFVFASTGGAIYGDVPEGVLADEDTRPNPQSPYAISKFTVEQLLPVYQSQRGLKSFVLRYANVYGPRQDPHGEAGVIAIFLARIHAGQALAINARREAGDAGCVRDYVYVGDVARLNVQALEGRLPLTCMNVATGTATTTRALAQSLMSVVGKEVPLQGAPPRAGDLERSVLDPARGLQLLGSTLAMKEGLTLTNRWYAASARN